MALLDSLIAWIESHPNTVQAITWAALIVLAWITGLFKWVRRSTRKPRLTIVSTASRVLVEEFPELDGRSDVVRASFLVNAAVSNRSTEKVVIEAFEFTFRRRFGWKPYGPKLGSISLPNRPRQAMGSGEKTMPVYFTQFKDGEDESLTLSGKLHPKDFCGGYLLFVAFTFGAWNPLQDDKGIKIHLYARLTTGERVRAAGYIPIIKDGGLLEEVVPGILKQIEHEAAWNVPAQS